MYINLLIVICFCSGFKKKGRVGCDGAAEGMSVFTAFSQRRQVGCAKYFFSDARAERPCIKSCFFVNKFTDYCNF